MQRYEIFVHHIEIVGWAVILYLAAVACAPLALEWLHSSESANHWFLAGAVVAALAANFGWGLMSLSGWVTYVFAPIALVADTVLAHSFLPSHPLPSIAATAVLVVVYWWALRLCRRDERRFITRSGAHER